MRYINALSGVSKGLKHLILDELLRHYRSKPEVCHQEIEQMLPF